MGEKLMQADLTGGDLVMHQIAGRGEEQAREWDAR
jgi:hypothetical protein